jgi:hypothetical protein
MTEPPNNAVQGVTSVATGAIDALKTSPALLALVMMQLVTLGLLVYNASKLNEHRHEREMFMLNKCLGSLPNKTGFKPWQGPPIELMKAP